MAVAVQRLADVQEAQSKGKQSPPGKDDCRRLIETLSDEFGGAHAQMQEDEDLFYSAHKIPMPKDVEAEGVTAVYTFKAAQQVMQGQGIMGDRNAELTFAATNTRSDAAKSRVELLQNHVNRGMDRLEQQSGELTLSMVTQDVLKFGRGIDCLEPDPRRIGKYPKSLDDFSEPKDYRKDRKKFIERMGTRGGRLPMNLRHVSPLQFMYRNNPDLGGISVAIERRDRYVADVMHDPRYKDSDALEWVWKEYYRNGTRDDRLAGAQKVSVWTIQDDKWTTQFVTPPMYGAGGNYGTYGRPEGQPIDAFSISNDLGEVAFQARNPLGRPWYTVTTGLRTSSSDHARSLIGIYYYARSMIRNLDFLLTLQEQAVKNQAFSPWVYIRGTPSVNGQQLPLLVDPQKKRIRISRGNGYITELDPGTIEQLIAQAPPELGPLVEQIRREINLLLIPESLYDAASSSSGYEYNSVRNTVLSKLRPIIEGMKAAMIHRGLLYADEIIWMGETISVSTVQEDNLVEMYAFDPKEYRELEITVDADLKIPRPEDNMSDLQTAAFAVEKRLLDVARARAKYLGETAHDEIDRAIALDDYKRSPQVAEFVIAKAAEEAGLMLEEEAADAQGGLTTEQLLNTNPALLASLVQQAQPGTPGYEQIIAAAEAAGIVPPTPAAPQEGQPGLDPALALSPAAPMAGLAPPTPAGQQPSMPGGPRLTGGMPV